MSQLKKRKDVRVEDTWAIEDLFPTEEAWSEAYQKVEEKTETLKGFNNHLGDGSKTLLEFLELNNELGIMFSRVFSYAKRIVDVDTTNSHSQDLSGRVSLLARKLSEAKAFSTPEILLLSEEALATFYEEEQELLKYKGFLNEIRRMKAHTLSTELEMLLASSASMGETANKAYTMFKNADLEYPYITDENGEEIQVTQGRFVTLLHNKNEKIRRDTFKAFYHNLEKYKNTFATLYEGNVNTRIFYAKAKKYNTTLEAAVDANNVPIHVYHNLIDSVHKNMHYMHKYISLRKKLLKTDELHMHDIYVPIVKDADVSISFDEAKNTVYEAMAPLGKEYQEVLKKAFTSRWIDVYENEGKVSGAYNSGNYSTHPFVLMNYQGTLDNEFTLAHEMGHAMHSYLSCKNQIYVDSGYKIFVAEVASTCNEALLMEYLLERTTDKYQRAYLINYFLEQFRTTLYRQTMFAEFEMKTHAMAEAGEPLTAEKLSKLYYDLNVQYFGKDIVVDDEIAIEWARIPHFYMNFYVYQYATSFAASISISKKILNGGKEEVDKYLKFLSSGCTKAPVELLKDAGVDMTTAEPIDSALQVFGKLIDELEQLLS